MQDIDLDTKDWFQKLGIEDKAKVVKLRDHEQKCLQREIVDSR